MVARYLCYRKVSWKETMLLARALVAALLLTLATGAPQKTRVSSLPGFNGSFASAHYAGYIAVDGKSNRQLYYYFVTSERSPKSDSLVLWLNGGPGCSSFDGFVYEHGPFNFHVGKENNSLPTLTRNPYTWSKVASMLYVDSPAGVGFSYSKNTEDYRTGDLKTASDLHSFLLKWFSQYPEFRSNPLYIAGESYAGVYVPTFAQAIVNGNEEGALPFINFKGYMVGNGVTDEVFDGNALVPFAHGMGLISDELYKVALEACDGNYWNGTDSECVSALNKVNLDLSDLNLYNILAPCYHDPSQDMSSIKIPLSIKMLGNEKRSLPVRKRMFGRAWPYGIPFKEGYVPNWNELGDMVYVPCLDFTVATLWLNDASVRQALHALPISSIGEWQICTKKVSYHHDAGSMIPFHMNLTRKGYAALIYSGDHDMCVPFTGSQSWTASLAYGEKTPWSSWLVNGQVAGYSVAYEHNLTFATVKGAGHTVPEYKPKEALAMFQRWLETGTL